MRRDEMGAGPKLKGQYRDRPSAGYDDEEALPVIQGSSCVT